MPVHKAVLSSPAVGRAGGFILRLREEARRCRCRSRARSGCRSARRVTPSGEERDSRLVPRARRTDVRPGRRLAPGSILLRGSPALRAPCQRCPAAERRRRQRRRSAPKADTDGVGPAAVTGTPRCAVWEAAPPWSWSSRTPRRPRRGSLRRSCGRCLGAQRRRRQRRPYRA
eukprot:scaffold870_cov268-Pinguiococcus_pyrenoidosus.AAC.4